MIINFDIINNKKSNNLENSDKANLYSLLHRAYFPTSHYMSDNDIDLLDNNIVYNYCDYYNKIDYDIDYKYYRDNIKLSPSKSLVRANSYKYAGFFTLLDDTDDIITYIYIPTNQTALKSLTKFCTNYKIDIHTKDSFKLAIFSLKFAILFEHYLRGLLKTESLKSHFEKIKAADIDIETYNRELIDTLKINFNFKFWSV